MSESIKQRISAMPDHGEGRQLKFVLDAILTDLTALRASIVAITAKIDVATTKLNADAGVTDTNYATNFAATCDPAALTTTS